MRQSAQAAGLASGLSLSLNLRSIAALLDCFLRNGRFVLDTKKKIGHYFFMEKKEIIKSLIRKFNYRPLPQYIPREIDIPPTVEKLLP